MKTDLERAVQWYPGHMVRAMRRVGEYLKLIDIVIEVTDARVPSGGRNPMLDAIIGSRKRMLMLNFDDLADPAMTRRWVSRFEETGTPTVAVDGRAQPSVKRAGAMVAELAAGANGIVRAIVLGLPNCGKSSIINGLLRRKAAKTEDRAGVTRQLQWFRMAGNVELLDTPGILVPKIDTSDMQWKLALVNAVPRERYDPEEIAAQFYRWVRRRNPETNVPDLEGFARARGFARKGGEIDYHTAARSYLRTAGEAGFGRFTFEDPNDDGQTA